MSSDVSDVIGGRRRTAVAIVEDDASFRVSLRRLCNVLGFTATGFTSGRAFLETLDDGSGARPDCLLVDIQMPGMTGLELHGILRDRGVQVPTIVITADDAPDVLARYASGGLTAYLQKPIGADELLRMVEQVTGTAPTASKNALDA